MTFRIVLQPAVAVFLAIRAGLRDAKSGAPPYLWTVLTDAGQRRALVLDGWKDVGRVFIVAIVLDVVYQVLFQGSAYPGETLVVATVLAVVPYIAVRGPVTRIASRWTRRG
jgi:hypothetical protein